MSLILVSVKCTDSQDTWKYIYCFDNVFSVFFNFLPRNSIFTADQYEVQRIPLPWHFLHGKVYKVIPPLRL
jgi:hypothetical protein